MIVVGGKRRADEKVPDDRAWLFRRGAASFRKSLMGFATLRLHGFASGKRS
jgi:hypothetical protein